MTMIMSWNNYPENQVEFDSVGEISVDFTYHYRSTDHAADAPDMSRISLPASVIRKVGSPIRIIATIENWKKFML